MSLKRTWIPGELSRFAMTFEVSSWKALGATHQKIAIEVWSGSVGLRERVYRGELLHLRKIIGEAIADLDAAEAAAKP